MHKKNLGCIGEALVVAQIIEQGCSAFVEFGDNSRADIVAETGEGLKKVQVKVVSRDSSKPNISTLALYKNGPGGYRYRYTLTDVDFFALVDEETRKIAWIEASVVLTSHRTQLTLRHKDSKNNQKKKVSMFDDYTDFPFCEK